MPNERTGRKTVYNAGLTDDYEEIVSKENRRLISEFVAYLNSADKSEQTIKQYEAQLKIWAVWNAKENDNTFFVDMKKRQFVKFFFYVQNDLKASNNRINSFRFVLSSLSNFIERIMDDEYPQFRNIVKVLEPISVITVREKTVLSIDEIKECLERLVQDKKYEVAAFLAVLVSCGARKSEILQFTVEDFTENNLIFDGLAYETHPVRSKGKGKAGHVVTKIAFRNIVDMDKYISLWTNERNKIETKTNALFLNTIDNGAIEANVSTANRMASVIEEYAGKPIYCHAYRHACCTYLLKQGIPKDVVQQIFRWKTDQIPTYDDRDKNEELAKFMISFAGNINKD